MMDVDRENCVNDGNQKGCALLTYYEVKVCSMQNFTLKNCPPSMD